MSFILDALKKSEADRHRQTGPALFEVKVAPPRARFPIWAVIAGVLLGVNLLGWLWYLVTHDNAQSAPKPAIAAATTMTAAPTAAGTPTAAVTPTIAASPIAAAPPTYNPPLIDAPVTPPVAGAAAAASAIDATPEDFEPAVVPTGPVTMAAPTSTASHVTTAPAGMLTREQLIAAGHAVPELAISMHVFDPAPARRFVFINGQRAREGETLGNGVRLERITADGAVFSYRGQQFALPLE